MKATRSAKKSLASPRTIHLIVTCTERKTKEAAPSRRVGALKSRSLEARITKWTHRLAAAPCAELVPAISLYSGDHWSIARTLAKDSGTRSVALQLWICSAGYGLLRPDTLVASYAATFSAKHKDSISGSADSYGAPEWWKALAKWRPAGQEGPRSVTALAKELARRPDSFLLIAVSKPYLDAMRDDLKGAVDALGKSDRVAIISAGSYIRNNAWKMDELDGAPAISEYLMPTSARLKAMVGGAMQALNIRLARHAVAAHTAWFPSSKSLARRFANWLVKSSPLKSYARTRLTDQQVRTYIRRLAKTGRTITASGCLRRLRDEGQACEQKRFSKLFTEVAQPVVLKGKAIAAKTKKHGAR